MATDTKNILYSDIDLSFKAHPVTRDIMKVTDIRAVLRALHLLVRTHRTEILMEPEINGGIDRMMFRNNSPLTMYNIKKRVTDLITNHEPRIELHDVEAYTIDSTQSQELYVKIMFWFSNIQELQTYDLLITRLR